MWLTRSAHKHIGQDTLNEHLDGRLRGRPLKRVERQLEECDACRQELAELQATVAMMRQMPMETPRRSFVMSAPPPEPVRVRPAPALRAPNWVYAGAASIAALALAITVSVDATGGLSSDPPSRDVGVTALATTVALEESGASRPEPAPGTAAELAQESASRSGEASEPGNDGAAPPSLAAAAPARGATAFEATIAPLVAPAPVAAPDLATQDSEAFLAESAGAQDGSQAPAPTITTVTGDNSSAESQIAKSQPVEAPTPISETVEPELFDQDIGTSTSIWWRVLEAAAGALTAAFLAGLALRWRAGRRSL